MNSIRRIALSCNRNVLVSLSTSFLLKSAYRSIFHNPICKSNFASMSSAAVAAVSRIENVVKSPEDKREYRALELKNGLKVLLVSDPSTDKSAASLDVGVGHLMDPRELPGLAHFCEHMLFLGTEKYDSENAYFKFVQQHGGSANAYTASDHTNYHFDIAPEHLEGAVDRFAQFFLCPLFTESATEREVNAVDSENSNNIKNDGWRLVQLERSLADSNHDYSKFGTGNKQTLLDDAKTKGLDTRNELLAFHKKHYSSNVMCFCIVGKESLDELESKYVEPFFEKVDNKNVERAVWNEHPYGPDQLGFRIEAAPIKDIRGLHVTFPIPDLHPHYRSQPGHYISHLLGHEGPGSLLSELKRRGWVNSLSSGPRSGAKGFAFFSIDVDLSEDGLKHSDEIVLLIFEAIGMIKRAGPQEWIHRECKQLNDLTFRFKDKERPLGYARNLSSHLMDYPLEEALVGPFVMDQFRPDLINMVLDKLTPDNMTYLVLSKDFEGRKENLIEKWYGTEYKMDKFDKSFIDSCREAATRPSENLKLPEKNEFIPTNFELNKRDSNTDCDMSKCNHTLPTIIRDDRFSRIWYKQDDEFLLPKCCVFLHLTTPMIFADPLRANLAAMFATCFRDALTEYTYNASLAGLSYSLENGRYGLVLKLSGYNEKQRLYAKRLVEKIVDFEPDRERFESLKELYVRSLKNFDQEQPYNHAVYYTTLLLSEKYWSKEQLLAETEGLTVDNLKKFVGDLLSAVHIEALETVSIVDDVLDTLRSRNTLRPLYPSQMTRDRELEIGKGDYFAYEAVNKTHENSAVEVLIQTGVQETRENMRLELLCQILHEPAFDTLRTKEQLGYIIFTSSRRSNGTQGLRFIVQGAKDPKFAEERVEAFLHSMRKEIEDMPDEEFNSEKQSLAAKRLERPKRLSGLASRYWSEIATQQYNFDRAVVEVDDLENVTKAELLEYYDRLISRDSEERRKLSVRVKSSQLTTKRDTEEEAGGDNIGVKTKEQFVTNITSFKQRMPLFPLPKPFMPVPPPGSTYDGEIKSML